MQPGPLGILMLDTRFPRLLGDVGHPGSWPFPVRFATVAAATPDRIVSRDAPPAALLPPFVDAARMLAAEGATAITTSCGFLSLFQDELAAAVPVPVATSSLSQVPWTRAFLPPERRVGVITVDAGRLTPTHLAAAGAPTDTPVVGTEGGRELTRVVLNDLPTLDAEAAERDVLDAGAALAASCPDLGAVVLECTNMAPYRAALARALDRPVFDIVTLGHWLCSGAAPAVV